MKVASEKISDLKLERYLLGEVSTAERDEVETQLSADRSLKKKVQSLRRHNAEFRGELPFEKLFSEEVRKKAESPLRQFRFTLRGMIFSRPALALATGLIVFLVAPTLRKNIAEKDKFFNTNEITESGGLDGRFGGQAPIDRSVIPGQPAENGRGTRTDGKPVDMITGGDGDSLDADIPASTNIVNSPDVTVLSGKLESKNRGEFRSRGPDANDRRGGKDAKKIIKTGNVSLEVDDTRKTILLLEAKSKSLGGYVENQNIYQDASGRYTGSLSIRIPSEHFDAFMRNSGEMGKVLGRSASRQDITKDYYDIQLRLKNDAELRNRLITILRTRTGKLIDILEIEREIGRITERLEMYKGNLAYYDKVLALSQISMQLQEPSGILGFGRQPILVSWGQRLVNGFYSLINLFGLLLEMSGYLILLGLAGWFGYRFWQRRKAGKI